MTLTLYDWFGNEYIAKSVPSSDIPSFQEGYGRYWESVVKLIDGMPVDFFLDVSRGRFYYFLWNNEWYRIDAGDFLDLPNVDRLYTHPPISDFEEGNTPISGGVSPSEIIEVCRQAKEKGVRVHIVYVKKNGVVEDYYIEPYSLREEAGNTFLYGYPMHEDHIEKYYLSRILSIELTESPFTPRWTVEFGKEVGNASGFEICSFY